MHVMELLQGMISYDIIYLENPLVSKDRRLPKKQ